MAIGYSSPRIAPPPRRLRRGSTGHHLPESLATLAGRLLDPVRLDFFEAFITPPQPFAEAERKASLNVRSIIRFTANSLRIFARRGHFNPESAGAALAERLLQFGQDDFEF